MKKYSLPCVKCPYCQEIVEAQVEEKDNIKKIVCPACRKVAKYPIIESDKS